MEEELKSLVFVGVCAIISVSYCYYLPPKIKAGVFRLLSILPVCALFLALPLFFSLSIFSSIAAFLLSGLANLRLILFAFDQGPLFPLPSNLFRFTCFTCFPIQLQQNPKSHDHIPKWVFPIKVAIFTILSHIVIYKPNLPPTLLLVLHLLFVLLSIEILLTILRVVFTIILGSDLEPQFSEPYLSTSLQDFWGRRWNLLASASFRAGVYIPARHVSNGLMSSDWGRFMGYLATFLVSGLSHELFYFYVIRETPTWEITWFFVLHGLCTAAEVTVKRRKILQRWWPVRPAASRLLTMVFFVVTGAWLFLPQFIRCNPIERGVNETLLLIDFFRRKFIHFLGYDHLNVEMDF
ncbi:unnamed protein product [Microthlaspi erraticum]|uniref:Wax synthase domain-containing protein n=1 Tax=Microthlaspi erraticum TaxID=1685480 RepID=A0A6D2I7F3_9BRAS|nr:unnamed protein product [Microthlaspi erraticum]